MYVKTPLSATTATTIARFVNTAELTRHADDLIDRGETIDLAYLEALVNFVIWSGYSADDAWEIVEDAGFFDLLARERGTIKQINSKTENEK